MANDGDGTCECCGNKTSFHGLNGYSRFCSVNCVSNDPALQLKRVATSMKNWGVDNPSKSSKIKEITIQNNIKKYGKHPSKLDITKQKMIKTCQLKYGVDNPYQTDEFQAKYKQTCQDRYGVDNPFELLEIQNRIKKTCLEKYGTEIPARTSSVKQKSKDTCVLKFGVDNHSKTFEARLRSREMLAERIEKECGSKINPMRGKGEKPCFDELEEHIQYKIDRDVSKIGYYPDGFIHEANLVIEFDEPEHQTKEWYKAHDSKRDEDFLKIECRTFRIKQTEWDDKIMKTNIINQLKGVLYDGIKQRSKILF
jgi:very-short-patch-repair endonuclease